MNDDKRSIVPGRTAPALVLVLVMTLLLCLPLRANAAVVQRHRVSNVTDKAFTVSWTTKANEAGSVVWGPTASLGNSATDDRGSVSDDTHHVTIGGLEPSTIYYFDIMSGGTRDNNAGAHYQVTTGPTLLQPGSDLIYGQVFKAGGTSAAEGTIVYLQLENGDGSGSVGASQVYSSLVESSGYWGINMGTIRSADLTHWFAYSGSRDRLVIEARGGGDGSGVLVVDTASDSPAPAITLGLNTLLPGDANGDGRVNAIDITKVERVVAGLDASRPGADANEDGIFDAMDITSVERLIATFGVPVGP